MNKTMKKTKWAIATAAVTLLATSFFYATQEAEAQSGTRRAKQTHYDLLWNWLQRTHYKKWKGADGKAATFQQGESPHGALVKVSSSKFRTLPSVPN